MTQGNDGFSDPLFDPPSQEQYFLHSYNNLLNINNLYKVTKLLKIKYDNCHFESLINKKITH